MKRPVFFLAAALFLVTCALLAYRILWLGYPAIPAAAGQTWQLLVNVYVTNQNEESVLSLALPLEHTGNMIVEERVFSGRYTFNTQKQGPNRLGVWSGTGVTEPEEITYRATIHARPRRGTPTQSPLLGPYPPAIGSRGTESGGGSGGRVADPGAASPVSGCRRVYQGRAGRGAPERCRLRAVVERAPEARSDRCGARPLTGRRPPGTTR